MSSWNELLRLRKRGQRPEGFLFVSDNVRQRVSIDSAGGFSVPFPSEESAYLVAGLEAVLIADRNEQSIAAALLIAGSNPSRFFTYFRETGLETVIA